MLKYVTTIAPGYNNKTITMLAGGLVVVSFHCFSLSVEKKNIKIFLVNKVESLKK